MEIVRIMRIPSIYIDYALSDNNDISIDGQAAQHLLKALRMKNGDALRLFNGNGRFYPAVIKSTEKKSLTVQTTVSEASSSESRLHTHLGQTMSRGDRMDYAVQKSTEMGVTEITPLSSERCELKLSGDRAAKRIQHWQQVAISAAEQCGRASVPTIHPIMSVSEWVAQQSGKGLSLVLHHRDKQHLSDIQTTPEQVNILIGPEGGLSDSEIANATKADFMPSTFGPRVLRTETAPVTCLALLQWLWGDYQQ